MVCFGCVLCLRVIVYKVIGCCVCELLRDHVYCFMCPVVFVLSWFRVFVWFVKVHCVILCGYCCCVVATLCACVMRFKNMFECLKCELLCCCVCVCCTMLSVLCVFVRVAHVFDVCVFCLWLVAMLYGLCVCLYACVCCIWLCVLFM